MAARKNETTTVINRNLLDDQKSSISTEKDWIKFRNDYNNASKLNNNNYPVQLNLELNSSCNMKCPFCVHGYEKSPYTKMNRHTFVDIIEEAVKIGVKSIKFSNINEPLLNSELESFIEFAIKKGIINTYLATNAILLNEKRAKSLIDAGLTKIFISIDATTEETYNKQRLSGKYNTVIDNILNLIKIKKELNIKEPYIRVSFLENKINKHEKEDFIKFWKKKADMIGIQKMYDVPNIKTNLTINNKINDFKCSMPFKLLTIVSNGDIYPCCTMYARYLKLGNINTMTLKEAWDSPLINIIRKLHKESYYHLIEACQKCANT